MNLLHFESKRDRRTGETLALDSIAAVELRDGRVRKMPRKSYEVMQAADAYMAMRLKRGHGRDYTRPRNLPQQMYRGGALARVTLLSARSLCRDAAQAALDARRRFRRFPRS